MYSSAPDRRVKRPVRDRHDRAPLRFVGESTVVRDLFERLDLIADAQRTTLICGATGSGKELVASALHERGRRSKAPMLAVNCAALPDSLIDSELFGHVRGAFTGAAEDRDGLAGAASGGTLFLDEVDALDSSAQAKLLRFLETGEYRSVGSDNPRFSDVWVLAATNRSLDDQVAKGRFREDLLYRLQVPRVDVPPLCARGHDIELLADHFLRALGREDVRLTSRALRALRTHHWPGNVRELRNRIEQAAVLVRDSLIDAEDLGLPCGDAHGLSSMGEVPAETRKGAPDDDLMERLWRLVDANGLSLGDAVEVCERMIITAALRDTDDNRTRAAERLGIHVRTIFKKLHRLERRAWLPDRAWPNGRGVNQRAWQGAPMNAPHA